MAQTIWVEKTVVTKTTPFLALPHRQHRSATQKTFCSDSPSDAFSRKLSFQRSQNPPQKHKLVNAKFTEPDPPKHRAQLTPTNQTKETPLHWSLIISPPNFPLTILNAQKSHYLSNCSHIQCLRYDSPWPKPPPQAHAAQSLLHVLQLSALFAYSFRKRIISEAWHYGYGLAAGVADSSIWNNFNKLRSRDKTETIDPD